MDADKLILLAKGGAKPLAVQDSVRAQALRRRRRDMAAAGNSVDEVAALMELAELTADPKVLRSLVSALRRKGDWHTASRLAKELAASPVPAAKNGSARGLFENARGNEELQEVARAESRTNSAELQSNRDVLSQLEDLIAARIGTPVRHVRSESVLKARPVPRRSILYRRAYTKHWFEVSGAMDEKLRARFGDDRLLVVFVKSSSELRIRSQLEFILNEQAGRSFRAPYFFGQFTASNLQVAAWESIDITQRPFLKLSFEEQTRVVEAIAAVNALSAADAAPVETKWIGMQPKWFEARYLATDAVAHPRWKDLYARTVDVLKHQDTLAAKVRSAGEHCVTHNDVTLDGSNFVVTQDGEVVLFDWEGSTLSVPGADVGLLTQVHSGERLMPVYVERMAQHGFRLDIEQIRFTADVVWGFRLLQAAWRRQKPDQVELAVRMLARHTDGNATSTRGSAMKVPSPELTARISEHLSRPGKKPKRPYQPIPHPAFSELGHQNGPERFELIVPHLEYRNGTVLDIGSNWGYIAHRLEDLGYRVTAVEASKNNAYFLTELRELCGKQFTIIHDSVFNLVEPRYDIVFALNIFHHFMKSEEVFRKFESLLARLKCRMMIYQAHVPSESQMAGAYRNMNPQEATRFLSERLSLPRIVRIGTFRNGREIFKLSE